MTSSSCRIEHGDAQPLTTRRAFLQTLGAGVAAAALARAVHGTAAERPNLLIIHTDEHNFRTLGCYRDLLPPDQAFPWGKEAFIETPNIDALAREGAISTGCYATSPVCSPSRAAFVSGRYPQNTPVVSNDIPMDDEIVTFAEVLRKAGYATGYAGKWHLDGPGKPQWAPERQFGFQDNRYMFNRGHWKKLEETEAGPRVAARNAKDQPHYGVENADEQTFTTDFLADRAVRFIEAHRAEPFCFMVSFPDPHGPDTVRAPYDTMFEDRKGTAPRTGRAKPDKVPAWGPPQGGFQPMGKYFGMIKCIDDNVGKIRAALRRHGLENRTVIVFTSDHGDLRGEHGRQNKGVPYEGSMKIPFILRYPGVVKPGTVTREALGTVDFKPTILGLLGVRSSGPDEGRDASALFKKGTAPDGWRDIIFCRQCSRERQGWLAAVTRRYKLVVAPNDVPWLFDLEKDADELKNFFLDPAYRDTVRELGAALRAYGDRFGDYYADDPGVRRDLAWAAEGTGAYAPLPRTARPAAGGGKRRKGADGEEDE